MKQHLIRLLGASALVVSLGAWAQAPSSDFNEILIDVVPFGEELDLNDPTKLVPIGDGASTEGELNSRFGRATAFRAQQGGEEFGAAVSAAASANAGQPGFTVPKPPAAGEPTFTVPKPPAP